MEKQFAIRRVAFGLPLTNADVRYLLGMPDPPMLVERWRATLAGRSWALRIELDDAFERVRAVMRNVGRWDET